MSIPKPLLIFLLLLVVPLIAWGSYQFVQYFETESNPCNSLSRVELAAKYPALQQLLERHHAESDWLLSGQRQQDFMLNLEMGNESLNLDEALQQSVQQVDKLALLRSRQSREFNLLCRKQLP